jgi:hypothetical protein
LKPGFFGFSSFLDNLLGTEIVGLERYPPTQALDALPGN